MHEYHDLLPSAGDAFINMQFHREIFRLLILLRFSVECLF